MRADKYFYTAKGQHAVAASPGPAAGQRRSGGTPIHFVNCSPKASLPSEQGATLSPSKAAVQRVADIAGDWREEVVHRHRRRAQVSRHDATRRLRSPG